MTRLSLNWRANGRWCSGPPVEEDSNDHIPRLTEADHKARKTRRRIEDIKEAAKLEREALEEIWNL